MFDSRNSDGSKRQRRGRTRRDQRPFLQEMMFSYSSSFGSGILPVMAIFIYPHAHFILILASRRGQAICCIGWHLEHHCSIPFMTSFLILSYESQEMLLSSSIWLNTFLYCIYNYQERKWREWKTRLITEKLKDMCISPRSALQPWRRHKYVPRYSCWQWRLHLHLGCCEI